MISSGGQLERKYGCYVNPSLISQLKSLDIDCSSFPVRGSTAAAICGLQCDQRDFKSILLRRASQSLLLIDKSKLIVQERRASAIWMM
ncbi:L-fucose operon activator [Salmonella enterica subsp. enterica serovar Typhimurium]|nr:L-fucose operon activator [Salmonella enterica subsp. enterica serovar Typhimurium]